MTEAALKDRAMEMLRARFPLGFFWRQGATPFGRSGVPDILGVVEGFAVALEAKQPGRYRNPLDGLSTAQAKFSAHFIVIGGGIHITFDDVDTLRYELSLALEGARSRRYQAYKNVQKLVGRDADVVQRDENQHPELGANGIEEPPLPA